MTTGHEDSDTHATGLPSLHGRTMTITHAPTPSANPVHHSEITTDRESLITQTKDSLLRNLDGGPNHSQYPLDEKRLNKILPTYSNETLHRIINAPQETSFYVLSVTRLITTNDENINDWISVEPIIKATDRWPQDAIRAIPTYKHIASYTGPQAHKRIIQAQALISTSIHLFLNEGGDDHFTLTRDANDTLVRRITDEKLATLILTHEDPLAITNIITTRGITDPEHIRTVINAMTSTPTAINDGVL